MTDSFEKQIKYKGELGSFLFVPLNLSFVNVYVVSCTRKGNVNYFHMKEDIASRSFYIADKYRCPEEIQEMENILADAIANYEKQKKQ